MDVYKILKELKINYKEKEHNAVYTVEEAKLIKNQLDGIGCKNLFLTNKKGKYYLIVLEESKKANIKELSILSNETHLTFAKEQELLEYLNLTPGSVTPLGIINDSQKKVKLIIDSYLIDKRILVHPNTNTKTISIEYNDLIKIIKYTNHEYINF